MRPCAAPGLRGHTAWLGGVAAWVRRFFFFRGCRAGARSHAFRVAGGRFGDPAPSTVWLRKALRLARTHCAHPLARRPRVLVARQHAVSEPTSLTCVHGCGRGRGCRITRLGCHGARALVVHALRRRRAACWQSSGAKAAGVAVPRGTRGRVGGVLGARRGVADHTTTPRWRARVRIVAASFTIWSKEGKIDYVRAEHAPEERRVAPNPWVTSAKKKSLSDH